MPHPRPWALAVVVLCSMGLLLAAPVPADDEREWQPSAQPPAAAPPAIPNAGLSPEKSSFNIEAVVINPFRSANVGAQVSGVIERFFAEEGDFVKEGRVVVEIDPRRYQILADRAKERVLSLEASLKRLGEEAEMKRQVFELDATTKQELLKAQSEAEIGRYRLAEANEELKLAVFELDSCSVTAPFAGYIAAKLKQTDEPVERLERIFTLVDTSKVHAVANIPEEALQRFTKGTHATFVLGPGKDFHGVVDRVGKIIDPKSRTKRVYVLIDNPRNELEVGMTGSLHLSK
jgi:RND family efflux transporter MFP subunit